MKEEVFNKCAIRIKYANSLIVDNLLNNSIGYIDYTERLGKEDYDFKVVITLRDKKLRRLPSRIKDFLFLLLELDFNIWNVYLNKAMYSSDGKYDFSEHKSDISIPPRFTDEYYHYIHRNNMADNTLKCMLKVRDGYSKI